MEDHQLNNPGLIGYCQGALLASSRTEFAPCGRAAYKVAVFERVEVDSPSKRILRRAGFVRARVCMFHGQVTANLGAWLYDKDGELVCVVGASAIDLFGELFWPPDSEHVPDL